MTILTPIAVSSAPLLRAIQAGGDLSGKALAEAAGRKPNNITRDLGALEKAGLITREPGSSPALTQEATEVLAMLDGSQAEQSRGPGLPAAEISHHEIIPDPENPRRDFDSEGATAALQELANSIAFDGLLENLVLRPMPQKYAGLFDGPKYMIIAGERRWRAIGLAITAGQLPESWPVPHTLRDVDEVTARRLALVENLQRRDLKPLEEARALQQLVNLDGRTTADIAEDIGFTQRWAQQRLQLLQLSDSMQKRLDDGLLGVKDARVVLAIWDRLPTEKRELLEAGLLSPEAAKAWLDQQPVPLSDAAKLALCEFGLKAEREPHKIQWSNEAAVLIAAKTVRTEVPDSHTRVKVEVGDPALDELVKRMIFSPASVETQEGVETTRHYLQRRYYSDQALKEAFPSALDQAARNQALKVLRVQLHGLQVDAECEETGRYATAWLNVDPAIPAEIQDEIDAKRAAQAERAAHRQRENEVEANARTAALQVHLDRLNSLKDAEAAVSAAADKPAAAEALANEHGLPLPWWFNETSGEVVAANGQYVDSDILYPYQAAEKARRRLMVALANGSAGVTAPTEEPRAMDPDAMPREDFIAQVVADLIEESDEEGAPAALAAYLAEAVAPKALETMLAEEGWIYGEADTWDWTIDGARSLAGAIQRGEYASGDKSEIEIDDAGEVE